MNSLQNFGANRARTTNGHQETAPLRSNANLETTTVPNNSAGAVPGRNQGLRQEVRGLGALSTANGAGPTEVPLEIQVKSRLLLATEHERGVVLSHLNALKGRDPSPAEAWLRTYVSMPTQPAPTNAVSLSDAQALLDTCILGQQGAKAALLGELNFAQVSGEGRFAATLVGPPGVGKTVLLKKVAEIFGRPVIHISVDALADARSLAGYQSSFQGFVPGIFLDGWNKAACTNPIIFLDEFDKANDPSVQNLLNQLLDPQRPYFDSAYLGFRIDLSQAAFVVAVNDVDTVAAHPSLLSRIEPIIDLPGYSREQKRDILTRCIIPRFNARLPVERRIQFTSAAVERLLDEHAKRLPASAGGVRELETWVAFAGKQHLMQVTSDVTADEVTRALALLHLRRDGVTDATR